MKKFTKVHMNMVFCTPGVSDTKGKGASPNNHCSMQECAALQDIT